MSDITDADREAVSRLIEVIRDAKAEGADIKDCHEIWRSAFAAHRIAERERIADMIAAAHDENLRQGSNRVYGLMAVLDMLNLKDEPTTKGHGDE